MSDPTLGFVPTPEMEKEIEELAQSLVFKSVRPTSAVQVQWKDGKCEVVVPTDVVVKIAGELRVHTDGDTVVISRGDQYHLSGGEHHTNPGGGSFYDRRMKSASDPFWVRELMVERERRYRETDERMTRREFYVRAARRNIAAPKRGKFGRGRCSCDH